MEQNSQRHPSTLEQTLKQGAERRERELAEDDKPETDVDKLLNEQKSGEPKTSHYDEL